MIRLLVFVVLITGILLGIFAAFVGLIVAASHGLRALMQSRGQRGERALTIRYVALHLCEPLINSFIGSMLLGMVAFAFAPYIPLVAAIMGTSPMAILLLPRKGINFRAPYDAINQHLFHLGILRWLAAALTCYLAFTGNMLAIVPFAFSVGLLWHTVHWGNRQISMLVAQPHRQPAGGTPNRRSNQAGHGMRQAAAASFQFQTAGVQMGADGAQAARVTNVSTAGPFTQTTTVAPLSQQAAVPQVAHAHEVGGAIIGSMSAPKSTHCFYCPVCSEPAELEAMDCLSCGLIFSSRVPAALHDLPDYEVLRPLGSGGMSSVYLARRRVSERLCVIKTLASVESNSDHEWRANAAQCLKHEYDLLRQLDHTNIVRMLYWVTGGQNEFMVLEYVPGLTLEQRLTHTDGQGGILPGAALPVPEALAYGMTIAGVLDYLTRQSTPIIHHDIKPSNLIVRPDSQDVVLVDFGSAVVLPTLQHQTDRLDNYGTPGYAAPEQYNGQSSPKSDVYSLGATLYHLLTDDDPTNHPLEFPRLEHLPPDVAEVLHTALAREPEQRPTAQQLRAGLMRVAAAHG